MSFQIGDTVKYETLDEEYYSRGYGISMETKVSKIVSICYKLANGEIVEEKKLECVERKQSKSEPPTKD
jgi:hypothetical protein